MSQEKTEFLPILLGSDMNVYGMARAFYEAYGIVSKAVASIQLAPTRFSKIVDLELVEGFDQDPTFSTTMAKVAERYADDPRKIILIACGDGYAELVSKHKDELSKRFICPYIDYDLLEKLINKESFYKICDEYDLPYPKTLIITKEMAATESKIVPPFEFPVALKPANSVEYLSVHFEGRKKAFRIMDQTEFDDIVQKIYRAGYTSDLIAQDFIPGDDSHMRVLNAYVDQNHHVRLMCLGHPLLEDPTPAAIGNYVAIIPDYNEATFATIKQFLEKIEFTGFANFDMKFDERDGEYKLFEINLRQGRSSFFVTLGGYNLAQYLTEDRILNQPFTETVYAKGDALWLGVNKNIFLEYVQPGQDKETALNFIKQGKYGDTVHYKKDMSFKRWLLLKYMYHNYGPRFHKYFKENKG